MEPAKEALPETRKQLKSTIHKLQETARTLEAKENAATPKSPRQSAG